MRVSGKSGGVYGAKYVIAAGIRKFGGARIRDSLGPIGRDIDFGIGVRQIDAKMLDLNPNCV